MVSDVAWDREGSVSPIGWPDGIIQENDVLDAESLPKVQMPNRDKWTLPPLAQMEARDAKAKSVQDRSMTARVVILT